jgi:uncharacterized FlaG/YvyC family protein
MGLVSNALDNYRDFGYSVKTAEHFAAGNAEKTIEIEMNAPVNPYKSMSIEQKVDLEKKFNELMQEIMPDLSVKFRVHEGGQLITSIIKNSSNEVVREFPSEKILNIVYSICQKIGIAKYKKF